jgi:hypothetical protein
VSRCSSYTSCPLDFLFLFTDLQLLQGYTEAFVATIMQSTKKMPYGMRYLARETLAALRVRRFLCIELFGMLMCPLVGGFP